MTILAAAASDSAAPGTLAFLVIFGMAVILFFLFRSMTKHLRKVNAAARQQEAAAREGPGGATGPPGETSPSDPPDGAGQDSPPPRSRRITG